MDKKEVFKREVNYLKNERYRENANKLIELLLTIFLRYQPHQQENIIQLFL